MFQIKELLHKFKALQDPCLIRQSFADVLNEVCKIKLLNSASLEIKKNIIWLKVNPAIKQKIFLNKKKCLEMIHYYYPEQHIVDIK